MGWDAVVDLFLPIHLSGLQWVFISIFVYPIKYIFGVLQAAWNNIIKMTMLEMNCLLYPL